MTDIEKWRLTNKIIKGIVWTVEIGFVIAFIALCVAVHCQRKTIKALEGKAQVEQVDTATVTPLAVLPAANHIIIH